MTEVSNKSILEIVEENFHTAAVFEKYGISFSDGENENSLQTVCLARNLNYEKITEELMDIIAARLISRKLPFNRWKLEFLIDYIKHVHHDYAAIILPELELNIADLIQGCADKHLFLAPLSNCIRRLKLSMIAHNFQEEEIIFPYIRQLENLAEKNDGFGHLFVRTLRKPLDSLKKSHDVINEVMNEIRELTKDFTIPETACPRLRVLFRQLQELQYDILEHTHLENNILFPRARDIEKVLLAE